MLCEKCGNEVKGGDLFCGRCGARVRNGGETPAEASSGGAAPSTTKDGAGSGVSVGRAVAKGFIAVSCLLLVALGLLVFCMGRVSRPVIPDEDLVAIPGKAYRMQRTEVTQRQWEAVMGSNPSKFCGPDRPVENVAWDDCQKFIRCASEKDGRRYRLPTEEEWEYACRAGSTVEWGKRANGVCGSLGVMGWYEKNSGGETHPVAQKEPNAWGLYDMHGNVGEWCQDLYEFGSSRRVHRGGGWDAAAERCSVSFRGDSNPYDRDGGLGFRLVVSQE